MPTAVGSTTNNGLPIDQLIASGQASSVPAQTGTGSALGQDAFLKLLTTELQNQDPMSPMDDTQSVTQLAQFQALASQTTLANSFQTFQGNFAVLQSATLLGHTATVSAPDAAGNASSLTGTITALQVVNGQPEFTMTDSSGHVVVDKNGQPKLFLTSQITGLK